VNGAWPYLAKDVERETTLAQFSRTGRAERNGAVLAVDPGRMACVEFDPRSGSFVGYTPLPDPTAWTFTVPGGIALEPDGRVGLLRVLVCPGQNRLAIEHAARPGDSRAALATRIRVRGMPGPSILLNGNPTSLAADGCVALPRGS
jgi:hypothetical protein